jgi:hypothetical protein
MIEGLAVREIVGRNLGAAKPSRRRIARIPASSISAAVSRLAAFRGEQRRPFVEDSADLIREDREERYRQL